ncbi:TPA: hypothetical protein QDZ84_002525 [Shewanella algae]|uniref:hypothetical protein n=1 Tax=Shewanella TaxID=22 RepID=UPI0005EC3D8C|nr:hypothetical protein [Shewanella algae]EKT4486717.1 hypothetical protein [Shewanella algae]MCE9773569.1 hypothetical protein [Shewanella algae]HDS1207510.1 hypothetical protein [Shewanella algae]
MLSTSKILIDNLDAVLKKHQMRPSHFADMAVENGLDVTRSFMSRLMSGASVNITMHKLDALVQAINILEPGITAADLLTPDSITQGKRVLCFDELTGIINQLLFELTDLRWLTIDNDVPKKMVSDYIGINLRKQLPDMIQDESKDVSSG